MVVCHFVRRARSVKLIGSGTSARETDMNSTNSGYADVNGIKLYYEIYGEGQPLVLIHGGLTTTGEMQDG